jgi:protein tyrosine phosphatase
LLMVVRKEYGGIGEAVPPKHPLQFPKAEPKKIPDTLDKSDADILAEIEDLNQKIDDDDYKLNSQIARRAENKHFTRFPHNNFPYDATLVSLKSGRYINASYILGKAFIGTQSPMTRTTEDFWSMVLEQNASIVIMLNRLNDPGDDIYFPFALSDKKTYGKIHLELVENPVFKTDPSWRQAPNEEEPHAVIHRKVKIWQEGEEARFVNHFQYQNWRDFSAGNERAAAYLVRVVHGLRKQYPLSPIVIHCHAGVGRTSALITLIDQYGYLSSGKIDVKRSVERQRSPIEGRCHSMMQSSDQYLFCYHTLRQLSNPPTH